MAGRAGPPAPITGAPDPAQGETITVAREEGVSHGPPAVTGQRGRSGRLALLLLFASAMGWLEGVVVVYIRGLLGAAHGPETPLPAQVVARFGQLPWLLPTEQSREAATMIMLAAVAWLSARSPRGRWGAFLFTFGVWDIVYYVALYAMLHWPPHLTTMDVLFLLPPGPWWNQPVWLPLLLSCVMIATGVMLFSESEPDSGR